MQKHMSLPETRRVARPRTEPRLERRPIHDPAALVRGPFDLAWQGHEPAPRRVTRLSPTVARARV